MEKTRLDLLLKNCGYFESREKAQTAIKNGEVKIDEQIISNPAKQFEDLSLHTVEIAKDANKYVSRGAYKLEKALNFFNISAEGKIATDIGSSTGGFSDVLLQNGIEKIYAIDVGKNQLHEKIKSNKKVISKEETNFLDLSLNDIKGTSLVVIDVSFTSILPIVEHLKNLFSTSQVEIVSLIKPQFECGKDVARKYKGIIKDKKLHKQIILNVLSYWQKNGFVIKDFTFSPIKGGDGNVEYLLYTTNFGTQNNILTKQIDETINQAFSEK